MNINGISIVNRLTAATIRNAAYSSQYGTKYVDLAVGILPNNSNNLVRRTISVPVDRLLNGRVLWNQRTARYSHLMNIISSYAEVLWNVDFSHEAVVFLGFAVGHTTTPQGERTRGGIMTG